MQQLIAKRYVKALLEAIGNRNIEKIAKTLNDLAAAFDDPKFQQIMHSPQVGNAQREALLLELIGTKADKKMVNFIKTLGLHNRFTLIPQIAEQLQKEIQRKGNRYEGIVESPKPVDKKLLSELSKSLSQYAGATVVLRAVKSDRDGVRVKVEDLGLEASFSKDRVASDMITHILKAL